MKILLSNLHTTKANKLFNELKGIGSIENRLEIIDGVCEVVFKKFDENKLKNFCKDKQITYEIKETTHKEQPQKQQEHKQPPQKEVMNSISNPSFHFYKDKAYGKGLEKFQLNNNYEELFSIKDATTFELTTTYPGLLVGSGYNHPKLKENKDDFQLGFFFDHTTGLPLISGSSIKGVLRSVLEKEDFCKEVYGIEDAKSLVERLFENSQALFYDAFITETANKGKKIFGSDYITSHFSDEQNGEFKEPNPIKFLKILPKVTFIFQFGNIDEKTNDIFKQIIIDFGLGAKTNTGYGKFL